MAQPDKSSQSLETARVAAKLRNDYAQLHNWPKVAEVNGITGPQGNPSPGLAYMIAVKGYEPGPNIRRRWGWPPICPTCHQKITRHHRRHVDPRLEQMVQNLRGLEQRAPAITTGKRVYTHGGKRIDLP